MYNAIGAVELMVKVIVLAVLATTTLLMAPPSAGALPSATPGPVKMLWASTGETAKPSRVENAEKRVIVFMCRVFMGWIRP